MTHMSFSRRLSTWIRIPLFMNLVSNANAEACSSTGWIANWFFLVIGGWSNERIVLRKKQQADVLVEEFESNVINLERPTKMVIEVANSESTCYINMRPFLMHSLSHRRQRAFVLGKFEDNTNHCLLRRKSTSRAICQFCIIRINRESILLQLFAYRHEFIG